MPKFLIMSTYAAEGAKGLLKEGGSQRKAAVEKMVSAAGGRLEAMYFGLGDRDVYTIVDLPDVNTCAALSLTATASGVVKLSSVMLMTPEDIDAASKRALSYRPPGQ
jgi:uncharacterized protein with GYD domain